MIKLLYESIREASIHFSEAKVFGPKFGPFFGVQGSQNVAQMEKLWPMRSRCRQEILDE